MILIDKYKKKLSGNKAKIITNIFWALFGKVVNIFGALFVGILVARFLGPDEFGLMNYIISYVSIFTILSSFGLNNIEIRELAKNKDRYLYTLGTAFRIRLVFSVFSYLVVLITLVVFKADGYTCIMISVYSLSIFASCFDVIRNYFTAHIYNEYIVKSEIFRTIVGMVIKVLLLWFKAPLTLFLIATALDTFFVAGGYIFSYKKKVGRFNEWKYDKSLVPFLLKESFPLVLSGTAVIIYQKIDQVMIGNMIDNKSVGFFATASRFLDLILFIPNIITQTVTPLLITKNELKATDYEKTKQFFVDLILWFSVILSVLMSTCAYWLILYSYGSKYLPAVPVLQILAFRTVGTALSSTSGQIMIIEKNQRLAVIRNLLGVTSCVGLNILFIPSYGIVGAAWVTIITSLISGYLAHYVISPYKPLAKIQTRSILLGWNSLFRIKTIFGNSK